MRSGPGWPPCVRERVARGVARWDRPSRRSPAGRLLLVVGEEAERAARPRDPSDEAEPPARPDRAALRAPRSTPGGPRISRDTHSQGVPMGVDRGRWSGRRDSNPRHSAWEVLTSPAVCSELGRRAGIGLIRVSWPNRETLCLFGRRSLSELALGGHLAPSEMQVRAYPEVDDDGGVVRDARLARRAPRFVHLSRAGARSPLPLDSDGLCLPRERRSTGGSGFAWEGPRSRRIRVGALAG